jgi:adenosylcobinamide-GDP ribazoletransferase
VVLSALRGALGFLTRIPVGGDAADWRAFTDAPWAFPVVGAAVGVVLASVLLGLRGLGFDGTVGVPFLAALVAMLGIAHFDGVADLGDAAVVHGDAETRVDVLKDSEVGVGGVVALVLVLLGTASAAVAASSLPWREVFAAIVGAEVGAKTAMAGVACLGNARHDGLGSQFTDWNGPRDLVAAALVAFALLVPLLAVGSGPALVALGAFLGTVLAGGSLAAWANGLLEGVNGDVFGATDVLGRLVGLYAGVAVARLLTTLGNGVPA